MTKYVKVAVTTQYNIIRGVKPYRDSGGETSMNRLTGTASRKVKQNFCSAMLCKRDLSRDAVSVCLCVSLSVTFVHSVEMDKHIFFHYRVATPFQFFRTKRYGNNLTETP